MTLTFHSSGVRNQRSQNPPLSTIGYLAFSIWFSTTAGNFVNYNKCQGFFLCPIDSMQPRGVMVSEILKLKRSRDPCDCISLGGKHVRHTCADADYRPAGLLAREHRDDRRERLHLRRPHYLRRRGGRRRRQRLRGGLDGERR